MPVTNILNERNVLTTDPLRNFRFLVQFMPHASVAGVDFLPTVGFTQVSGLSVTTQSIPYREGSMNSVVHQIPGQSTFSPVTMQRGVLLGTPQNWNWMKSLFATVSGRGERPAGTSFRVDVEIAVLVHPIGGDGKGVRLEKAYSGQGDGSGDWTGSVARAMVIRLYNAWINSIAYSDLNAGDSAFLVEQLTLVHEGMEIEWGPDSMTGSATNPSSPA
jgi:phage tail-like protein